MTDAASTRLAAWEPGYRRLEEGEIILATDEVQNDDGSWKATICAGQRAPDPAYTAHRVYRRALSTAQASEREQIVAWLRASGRSDPGAVAQRAYATAFADAIERGDYLATPVEPSPADVERRPIMLEIAAAGDEHRKWERRWHDLQRMHAVERIFEDEDGRWGLRDFLNYAGLVCGYFLPSVTPKTEASEAAVGQIEPSPVDTVNEFDGPCPVCRCRTFAAVDDEFAPGRFQRCVECKTILDLAIYKASEPSPADVERVALLALLQHQRAKVPDTQQSRHSVKGLDAAIAALQSPPVEQPAQAEGGDFQRGVDRWMDACFGEPIKSDQLERADRFCEEALELCQTMPGFTKERAHALVDYVFDRPKGEINQEVGGVMVTLAALCNTTGINIENAAQTELERVWTKVEQIRAKRAAKPTGSALPIAQAEAQQPSDGLIRRVEYILDPSASAAERSDRRVHLTNHDLRCILSALKARTSPETVENFIKLHEEWQQAMELLRETRGTMAEQVRRCERWGKSHHEMDAAISAIDAHLSNTPDQGSDQHERS